MKRATSTNDLVEKANKRGVDAFTTNAENFLLIDAPTLERLIETLPKLKKGERLIERVPNRQGRL